MHLLMGEHISNAGREISEGQDLAIVGSGFLWILGFR